MILNGQAIRAASTGFHALFLQGWEQSTPTYPDLVMRVDSTGPLDQHLFDGGLPVIREWLGERQRQNIKLFGQTIANRDWEGTVSVSANNFKDDTLGLLRPRFMSLGVAAKIQPDVLLAELLQAGFATTGTYGACYDGSAFFATNHPTEGAATISNRQAGALSPETFAAALLKLRQMKDYKGNPIDVFALGGKLTLVVAPSLEATARTLLLAQFGANGATNVNFGRAEMKVFNRLPDGYWYLGILGSPLRPFIYQVREEASVVAHDQPADDCVWSRNEVEYGVQGRWAMHYGLWQLIVGSNGS